MSDTVRKKKVVIHTDYPLAMTGFGKNARNILEHLYKTDKYDIVNLAVGMVQDAQELKRTPWKTIGTIQPQKIEAIRNQNDPKNWEGISRMAGYGAFIVDEIIQQEKPDVYIAIQDIWGIDYAASKHWFDKISCALWTTLDSLPILEKASIAAKKSKNYWSWAHFATKALHKMGLGHVKTVRGALDTKNFYRLPNRVRNELRAKFNITPDTFVVGFVFRNQLRKSVPNLIQGFKQFKNDNPKLKTKLLLHTHWNEGWDIKKLLAEHGLTLDDVITTYVCKQCHQYTIKSFTKHDEDCPHCRTPKGMVTTSPNLGVTEEQLNEVYNLMDVYCHPFTSGGQEIPIQEAKLAEVITLVTNYSCGEDACEPEAGSLPLEWAEYREPDTMFIKASTYPNSIAKQLKKVLNMKPDDRIALGRKGREWVIKNFSIEVIGSFLEKFIDDSPLIEDKSCFDEEKRNPNPHYQMPEIQDEDKWILHLYHNILDAKRLDEHDDGFKHWKARLAGDLNRHQVEQYFRQVAFQEQQKQGGKGVKFEDFLDENDKGRVIVVVPESASDVFLVTSLFESIKNRYPDYSLYVATKPPFRGIIEGNPYVHRWIEYNPMMDNPFWLEGRGDHKGYFNVAYTPHLQTQRLFNYVHNQEDKLDVTLR